MSNIAAVAPAPATDSELMELDDASVPSPIKRSRGRSSIMHKDFIEGFSLANTDQPSVFDVMKVGTRWG